MTGFLKCYYGYKNRGDELLFFGVLDYLFAHYPLQKLYVEVGDKIFMNQRLDEHQEHLQAYYERIELLQIGIYHPAKIEGTMKFFGGGEVLSDEVNVTAQEQIGIKGKAKALLGRYFARAGRNYLAKYWRDVHKKKFVLLGGVTKPHKATTKFLYRVLLSRAESIICREKTSHALCKAYSTKVILHEDFALSVLRQHAERAQQQEQLPLVYRGKEYILINIHQKIRSEDTQQKVLRFCQQYPEAQPVFFPCDMAYDQVFYHKLHEKLPALQLYDWTQYSLCQTLALFAQAQAGIGARLHFLLPLKTYGVFFEPLVYAEKVKKIILNS